MKICDWIEMLERMDPDLEARVMYESAEAIVVNAWPTPPATGPGPVGGTTPEAILKPSQPDHDGRQEEVSRVYETRWDECTKGEQAHQMRAHSLALLRDMETDLKCMVEHEVIDNLPAAMMACHYALMELCLDLAMKAGEIPDPLQVLRDLFDAGDLEDHFYAVREQEGKGWEGPRMEKWGKACADARKLMKL